MADGVTYQSATPATPAAGVEIATDDCGAAGHAQLTKLAVSADGDATPIPATSADGLLVEVSNSLTAEATVTVDDVLGSATSSGLTTGGTLYTADDQMGDLKELTNMAATSGGSGYISTIRLVCDTNAVIGGVRVWFFSATVTSLAADNVAFSLSDADALLYEGHYDLGTPAGANNCAAVVGRNVNLDYTCAATSLFVAFQTLTTHTAHFAAVDDLHLEVVGFRY